MKRHARLLPAVLSVIILAAHFFRMQNIPFMAATLALLPLLFSSKQWIQRAIQISLLLGSIEWVRTILMLVTERKVLGMPYLRMVIILGGVAIFTIWGALLLSPAKSPACRK